MNIVECVKSISTLSRKNKVITTDKQFLKTIKKYNTDAYFLMSHTLSETLIEKYGGKLGWYNILMYQKLSESFIEKHEDGLDWHYICSNQILSESFIEKYQDKVKWQRISMYQVLSEPFIEKYQDKLCWGFISKYQTLSESFIEKHANKVRLDWIAMNQKLSDDFCKKHNIESNILNVVHRCGKNKRIIKIYKDKPDIIHIGCFSGTKDEAIKAIRKKYKNNEEVMNEYIAKVEECFNY